MKIVVETILRQQQRYPTCGDWRWEREADTLTVHVSDMADWRHVAAVAVHEIVEALLCRNNGISGEEVDAFDRDCEASCLPLAMTEPGDAPGSPYTIQHGFATAVERLLIAAFGLSWAEYEMELL